MDDDAGEAAQALQLLLPSITRSPVGFHFVHYLTSISTAHGVQTQGIPDSGRITNLTQRALFEAD
jgi:hypothetical protein